MSSEEEVSAILSAETHVEIDKLRVAAKHGIPPKLRGEAWKYLLSVSRPDKSEEMSTRRRDAEEYAKLDKANVGLLRQVKAEAKRRTARGGHGPSRALLGSPQTAKRLENIIAAFLNHNAHLEYDPGMVHLLCPFVYALDDEADAFHCFARLMKHLEPHFNVAGARHDLRCLRHFEKQDSNSWIGNANTGYRPEVLRHYWSYLRTLCLPFAHQQTRVLRSRESCLCQPQSP